MKFRVIASEAGADVAARELTVDSGVPVSFAPGDSMTFTVADDAIAAALALVDVGFNGKRSGAATFPFNPQDYAAAPSTPTILGVEAVAE